MTAKHDFLQSVFEAWLTLDHLTTSIHALVGAGELECQTNGDQDDQAVGNHARHDSWAVTWSINLTEHRGSDNATNTTSTDEGSRAKGTLPLATDVVGLVGEDGWDVGVGTDGGEEDTEVTGGLVLGKAEDRKTGKTEERVDDDGGGTVADLVGVDGLSEHEDTGSGVWWSDKALRLGDIETHLKTEDHWQEVGNGVGSDGAETEEGGKAPDLEIGSVLQVLAHVEGWSLDIGTVVLDTGNCKVDFGICEELPGAAGLVWEGNESEVTADGDAASKNTFHLVYTLVM